MDSILKFEHLTLNFCRNDFQLLKMNFFSSLFMPFWICTVVSEGLEVAKRTPRTHIRNEVSTDSNFQANMDDIINKDRKCERNSHRNTLLIVSKKHYHVVHGTLSRLKNKPSLLLIEQKKKKNEGLLN